MMVSTTSTTALFNTMRMLIVFVFMACLVESVEAQGRGSIVSGTVLQDGTTTPISGASVTLSSRPQTTTTTDGNGRFSFAMVSPGQYTLRVTREGYFVPVGGNSALLSLGFGLTDENTQRQAEQYWSIRVIVEPGRDLTNLVSKLLPGAVISGRVLNDSKSPLPNRKVVALRKLYVEGKIVTGMAKIATTDDRGEYRFLGLAAGDYFIEVQGNPTVYFPTSSSLNRAEALKIAAGADFIVSDITVPSLQVGRSIFGTLAGALPLSPLPVFFVIPADDSMLSASDFGVVPASNVSVDVVNRTFELRNVIPGTYEVIAKYPGNTPEQQGYYRGLQTIRVADANVSSVVLTFHANVNVAGRVVSDTGGTVTPAPAIPGLVARGGAPSSGDSPPLRIRIKPREELFSRLTPSPLPGSNPSLRSVAIDRSGRFQILGVLQGRYRVEVNSLPQNSYLADIRVSGRSIMAEGEAIIGDLQSELEVVIGTDGAVIRGVVRTSGLQPVSSAKIVLMSPAGRTQLRVFQSATSDSQGVFSLVGIAPGEYRLLALQDIPIGAESTPEFLSNYESDSKTVVVQRNGRLDVVLLPVRK